MKGLGLRVRELRKERDLTLIELAKKTGIDQATLCRIEKGRMTGTLDSHMRISGALGVSLPEFYAGILEKASEDREKQTKQKLETFFHAEGGAVAELLTTGILQKKIMPIRLRLKGGGRTAREEYSAGTERFVYVLQGSIEVHIADQPTTLKTGETLYFSASKAHYFANPLKSESVCLSVMTPVSL